MKKKHFADDYCPQREKVLDLSRSVMSGGRRFARNRRKYGRYRAKVDRQISRAQLSRAATWACICSGDPDVDCRRCYSDDLPTVSEIRDSGGLPERPGDWSRYEGFADNLNSMFRWYLDRTIGMSHFEKEEFLRAQFLASPFGHSVKTRHAYDHLFTDVKFCRKHNHDCVE